MRPRLSSLSVLAVVLLMLSVAAASASARTVRSRRERSAATGPTGPSGSASGGGASVSGGTSGTGTGGAGGTSGSTTAPGPVGSTTGPSGATGPTGATGGSGGAGVSPTPYEPTVPGTVAEIVNGVAYAPSEAPLPIQKAIWAGNNIRNKPYILGGGHGKWNSPGYDCSGSVSYILHAAGLLRHPDDSSDFETWGLAGSGTWITVYTNPNHAFIDIAGIRLDTSAEDDPNPAPGSGPRWRPEYLNPPGFMARHPAGY